MSQMRAPKNNVFYRNQNWHYPKVDHGKGIYIYDENGKEYIDGCSGSAVANLGHGNQELAEVAKEQMEKLAFSHLSRWTADSIELCAEKMTNWLPEGLEHVYFVSGGSEASETAIKMARQFYVERDGINTSKTKIISKWNSFHGNTLGALSLTGITGRRRIYNNMLMDSPKIHQFYHYRNPWGAETLYETSVKAANELEEYISLVGEENICAFISEPVVGSAAPGVHPDKVYFDMVREICTKYDILLIIDEVMSGFGRTGKKMALEHFDIKPDIVITAKGMSCGYTPIGAAICTDDIFNTIMMNGSGHFIHGHTYAGNPLSCAIASKVMEIMERDKVMNRMDTNIKYFERKIHEVSGFDFVGDIRGKGYMYGVEFVKDKRSKAPFGKEIRFASLVMEKCFEEGLVVYPGGGSVDGHLGDHILLAPPINITKDEIDQMIARLVRGFMKVEQEVGSWINL